MADHRVAPVVPDTGHARRTYLLDRAFQLKYALLLAAGGLVVSLVFGLWLHQAHAQALAVAAPDPEVRAALEASEHELLLVFGAISGLLALALAFLGVVVTHRVAGPVFVMAHYLGLIAQGRWPRMRTLRRGDELRPLFDTFLGAVGALKERERRHAALLSDAAARIRAAAARAPELAAVADALEVAAHERRLALEADDPEPTPAFTPAPPAPPRAAAR